MARYYIGPTTSKRVPGAERQREQACSDAFDLPVSPELARVLPHACGSIAACSVSLGCREVPWLQAAGPWGGKRFGWDHRPEQEASSNPILTLSDS